MRKDDNFFIYIITYPFVWIYDQLEYLFYVHIYPIWSGKAVAQGWNPKFVKEELGGLWNPSMPIDIPYNTFKHMANQDLMEFGIEKTKSGHLRRFVSPQMYYADPEKATMRGDLALKTYYQDLKYKQDEQRKELTLDPFSDITYYNKFKFNDSELLSWNIQMKVKFLGFDNIDVIELFLSIIFFLVLFLCYFIFYHLYKLNIKLKRAEFILNENGLSLFKSKKELTAKDMADSWKEGSKISKKFDLGIEIDYCLYAGSLISLELFVLMFLCYLYNIIFSFINYYIIQFYIVNMEFFTYFFVYIFTFLSVYYWLKQKREQKAAIHRWVELDYYFSHFLNHYFRTLAWLNLYKLVDDAPIYAYVLWYSVCMIWIYFACDSRDYFMGWNQEYRIDIYNKETNMHFWWPRILMNQTWHHFYITLMKPLHKKIIYIVLFFFLPLLAIFLSFVYYQNKIHVFINNKFFFWNSKKYTIDEIKEQWKKDKVYNYVESENEKNSKGMGLTIL